MVAAFPSPRSLGVYCRVSHRRLHVRVPRATARDELLPKVKIAAPSTAWFPSIGELPAPHLHATGGAVMMHGYMASVLTASQRLAPPDILTVSRADSHSSGHRTNSPTHPKHTRPKLSRPRLPSSPSPP